MASLPIDVTGGEAYERVYRGDIMRPSSHLYRTDQSPSRNDVEGGRARLAFTVIIAVTRGDQACDASNPVSASSQCTWVK